MKNRTTGLSRCSFQSEPATTNYFSLCVWLGGRERRERESLKESMKNGTWRRYKEVSFKKKMLESKAKYQRLKLLLKGKWEKKKQRIKKKKSASDVQAPLLQLIALILFHLLSSRCTFYDHNVWQSSASSFVRIHSAGRAPNLCLTANLLEREEPESIRKRPVFNLQIEPREVWFGAKKKIIK